MRSLMALALVIIFAQTATPPAFEVASIKPATPETMRSGQRGARLNAAHLELGYTSLAQILPYAFRVKPYQIVGPSWTTDSRWNILANLPPGSKTEQVPDMMKALLIDRFKLAFHIEKRPQPVYQLVVAEGGPKVELSTGGEYKQWDGSFPGFNFGGGLLRGNATITGRIIQQPACGQRWEFIP